MNLYKNIILAGILLLSNSALAAHNPAECPRAIGGRYISEDGSRTASIARTEIENGVEYNWEGDSFPARADGNLYMAPYQGTFDHLTICETKSYIRFLFTQGVLLGAVKNIQLNEKGDFVDSDGTTWLKQED